MFEKDYQLEIEIIQILIAMDERRRRRLARKKLKRARKTPRHRKA